MTATETVPLAAAGAVPEAAVTVIVLSVGSEPADNVAIAAPFASVVAWLTVNSPDVAEKVTVAPGTVLLFASRTNAVMVAGPVLSEATCGELVMTLTPATVGPESGGGGVVPPDSPVIDFELPPQAASNTTPNKATIDNLRMLDIPGSPRRGVGD